MQAIFLHQGVFAAARFYWFGSRGRVDFFRELFAGNKVHAEALSHSGALSGIVDHVPLLLM